MARRWPGGCGDCGHGLSVACVSCQHFSPYMSETFSPTASRVHRKSVQFTFKCTCGLQPLPPVTTSLPSHFPLTPSGVRTAQPARSLYLIKTAHPIKITLTCRSGRQGSSVIGERRGVPTSPANTQKPIARYLASSPRARKKGSTK